MLFTYGLSFVTALLCPALRCWGWLSANYIFQAPLLRAFQPGSALVGAQKSRGRDFCLWHQLHGKDWQLLVDSGAGRRRLRVSGRASRRLTRPGRSGTSLAVPAPSHGGFNTGSSGTEAAGASWWVPGQGTAASWSPDIPLLPFFLL